MQSRHYYSSSSSTSSSNSSTSADPHIGGHEYHRYAILPANSNGDTSGYESDSSIGVEAPPESPTMSDITDLEFEYTDPDLPISTRRLRGGTGRPEDVIRDEVFNQLSYCGFLDIRQAFLFRWAVGVVWSMHMFRQAHCSTHPDFVPRSKPPVVLYRLFQANAILPGEARESATTRVLLVLHALYYLSRVPSCAVCASRRLGSQLDLTQEDPRSFEGIEEGVVSRMTIEWAVAIRCAVAWLTDPPAGNYWQNHTTHIPEKAGGDLTTVFQKTLDYKFAIQNDKLIAVMHAITDDHPISLTPVSRRRFCPPPKNPIVWNSFINAQ